eukprot:CAMPEP_0170467192 /NCGR_PEP_ID=MMETSP0123-20130129/10857_1 /TAXON_ID=182087 /ORGANISM="Favella ehrenbergii, Strain Fehren 1" /LENGTH=57 /DNA_ID=CAMNT_0010733485 /DNA_START=477 /DNA_END=650 /DNA_ORIENTATION=-
MAGNQMRQQQQQNHMMLMTPQNQMMGNPGAPQSHQMNPYPNKDQAGNMDWMTNFLHN